MEVSIIDWVIIVLFFAITLLLGLVASRNSSKSSEEFFLSGRNLPWWMLGVSMVATTFSADTPNLVTGFVRTNGVARNWEWWAFLLTGMTTVFVYAKLWRRSGIVTDLEFYELRYSGQAASFLRGFRAIYLGVFFNIMIMASVMLAGIKFGSVMLGLTDVQTVLLVSVVTVFYSSMGGLRGVILTDFFQFGLSMLGMIVAAIYILQMPEVDGMTGLLTHTAVQSKTSLLPDFSQPEVAIPIFIMPLAVQWWSVWYPGAEPGGGGYIAQRMLSAKNENDATKATFLFNIAHYALRPWPWIIIALASLVFFPELSDLKERFPHISDDLIKDDLAFPAMLTLLPSGLMGLLLASIIAALMSTISTHLNWGSSYIVNDVYNRFISPDADESSKVLVGRIATVVLMILAAVFSLELESAMEAFQILLKIGAGTGLLFILRWFWWRINAYAEIVAMLVSFMLAIFFKYFYQGSMADYEIMLWSIAVTTISWLITCFVTPTTDMDVMKRFLLLIKPHKAGWKPVLNQLERSESMAYYSVKTSFARELGMVVCGAVLIYFILFGTGYLIYGNYTYFLISLVIVAFAGLILYKLWKD
ncbi:MAG TPA: Na+:solute symporter [Saprospiraceae bacterium]|nr:Na+:solute symporter [Saprospiraceae bacterium]MCB9327186.1 Na+:solute symporter [Lewinellaceae bacterium]HPQ20587.1 Na+:solute symporter [Saprospiraceae bacterium]